MPDQPPELPHLTVIRIFFRPLDPGVAYRWERGGEFACLVLSTDLTRAEQVTCVGQALDLLAAPIGPGYREVLEAPRLQVVG